MARRTRWTWIAAGLLGVGLTGSASADPWDRDSESGRMRMQQMRGAIGREPSLAAADSGRSATGRAMGRDTISEGGATREFHDGADMAAHMTQQVKMRGSEGKASEEASSGHQGGAMSRPTEVSARMQHGQKASHGLVEADEQASAHEQQLLAKSATGHAIGQDTLGTADVHRSFKDRNDMMAHLTTQTSMRASRTLAARGAEDEGASSSYPNAGHTTSDPSKLTDAARQGLARLGFSGAGKRQASADIEDKAR